MPVVNELFENHEGDRVMLEHYELFPVVEQGNLMFCFITPSGKMKDIGHMENGVIYFTDTVARMHNLNKWGDEGFKSNIKHSVMYRGGIYHIWDCRLIRNNLPEGAEPSLINFYYGEGEKNDDPNVNKIRGISEVIIYTAETLGCGDIVRYPRSIVAERQAEKERKQYM